MYQTYRISVILQMGDIGLRHSYFCGHDVCTEEWLRSIVDCDILPMLSEYWIDDTAKLQRWKNNLLNQILKTTVMILLRHANVDTEY